MYYNRKIVMAAMSLTVISGALTACGAKEQKTETQTVAVAPTEVVSQAEQEAAVPVVNEVFGEFTAVTLDGVDIDQNVFAEADLTMVNLWGTFCGYCIEEMPALGELSREYKDQGFQIVGILTDVTEPNQEEAVGIVEKTKADYTHILISESLSPSVAGVPLPTTVFLDKDGNNVGEIYAGAKDKASWDAIIQEMLKKVKE